MRVRAYLITLIAIVSLGACLLVGGLMYSYQELEHERDKRALSVKALRGLKYVKRDLSRLMTMGDLIFRSMQEPNAYLAKPTNDQIDQIEHRLAKVRVRTKLLHEEKLQDLLEELSELRSLFEGIDKGQIMGDENSRYLHLSSQMLIAFEEVFKDSQETVESDTWSFEVQQQYLKFVTWFSTVAYLGLIAFLTWWSNRSISRPVSALSNAANSSLDQNQPFPLSETGPLELRMLAKVLHRLINRLEAEVANKTADLEAENLERRSAESRLRVLNEHQRALVEASVRFVPRPFLEFLGRSDLTLVERGDSTRQQLGILFSDLRGFTTLAETRSAQEIFDLLNRYLDAVVPSIHANHGFVDKYIGDAIMALFPHKAERAVKAAIEMFHKLYTFVEEDGVKLSMGVGIHWGEVVLGTLGSEDRWESTVIGDTVNLAARLEGMTKIYSCPLIISDSVLGSLPSDHDFALRPLDRVRVKGRTTPVTIYEVIDAHPEEVQIERLTSVELSIEGFNRYCEGELAEAKRVYEKMQDDFPSDPLPSIFIERCEALSLSGLPIEWRGVFTHTSK